MSISELLGAEALDLEFVYPQEYKKFIEAIEIMASANQMEKLAKLGDSFLSEKKIELATLCFIPTKDKQKLNSAAVMCIQSKNYKLAAKAYEAADNSQMASFILQNFAGG